MLYNGGELTDEQGKAKLAGNSALLVLDAGWAFI